ncbi:MAG: hypothetical protein GF311_06295 [Candidatus Lokiarchaeota archaeon]|nr:hypothetical protein [Candidatus Lokiarchaeota archaeon]
MDIRNVMPSDAVAISKIQINNWEHVYKAIFPENLLQNLTYGSKITNNKR